MMTIQTGLCHDLVAGIVAALEAKDHFTADHSLRVSDMSERICRLLELTDKQTETIHMAAHVHDIGKIGVPDAVLKKPGALDDGEWLLIRRHPSIGAQVLNKYDGLSELAEIVLHHHERWDGRGYPDGLKGEEIPFGSRIIAICDSIDAMMSQRAYRRTLSSGECRKEILANSGIMYDPDIVKTVNHEWDALITGFVCTSA